ncbi:hypothetical protein [uncultured Aquimarina sp.]|uniref:hypothetical protein n=1 Tax=uncultured Aquimarina sp. TaxID=575652 RepID=UPI00260C8DBD|nr:hypothetical protein [uncultured Aquimarina sp.]
MKKIIVLLGITGILMAFSGCQSDDNNSGQADFFIEGTVDGEKVYTDYLRPGTIETYFTESHRFTFQRKISEENQIIWFMSLEDLDLDNVTFPITLRHFENNGDPFLDFSYINDNEDERSSYRLDNIDTQRFSVILTDWSNDILSGTFSGELISDIDTDTFITVTNGSFRIKLSRVSL